MLKRINWEITYRCNLNCDFCFLKSAKKLNASIKELNLEQAKAFIDSVDERKTAFYITGGEPFARQDCLDILEYIKRKGGNCGVNTNGTLLDERKIERLAAIGLDYVIFSLHGPPIIQDELSGGRNVFSRVANNIRALSAVARTGTEIIVSCTLNDKNYRTMDKLFKICRDLGAHRVLFEHLQFLTPAEKKNHAKRWKAYSSEPCRIITPCRSAHKEMDIPVLARQIEVLAGRGYHGVHFDIRPRLSSALLEQWYKGRAGISGGCRSVQDTMVVSPNGDVRLCQLFDKRIGNVMDTGWRDLWLSDDATLFRNERRDSLFPGCARCCQRFGISRYY